jgi:hypothetical protein
LLHEHHYLGGNHGTTVTADGEHLLDLLETPSHARLILEEDVHVEQVAGGLNLATTETTEGFKGLDVLAFAHQVARGLGL